MSTRMLIDARHQEETRVAVVKGNKIEEFDFESSDHKQLKGNIYLAKVTRVEPSLQAAFVDYGGNRHGFLAFSEIHPDYYQIPIEDREALKRDLAQLAENAQAAQAHVDEMDDDVGVSHTRPPEESGPGEDPGEEPGGDTMAAAARTPSISDRGGHDRDSDEAPDHDHDRDGGQADQREASGEGAERAEHEDAQRGDDDHDHRAQDDGGTHAD